MRVNSKCRHMGMIGIATALLLLINACSNSGSTGGGSSNGVSVTGTLGTATVSSADDPVSKWEQTNAVTDTKILLECGTSGNFTATVNSSTGEFSVSGVPTGVPCSFSFTSATSGAVKCQVQFQDSSNYDLNHNALTTSTATASTSVSLGSITCDTSGSITISTSSVSGVDSGATISSSKAFDFTGTWSIAAFDGTLPSGYRTAESNCGSNCRGPSVGEVISLVRFHGHKFTPSAGNCTPALNVTCPATAGTVDTSIEGYGMSIWGGNYANGIGACGAKTGFTADEARAYAGLSLDATPPSLSGNALSYGHYVFSTPTGFGTDAGWTQDWMYGGATSRWAVQDCQPVSVPSTSGGSAKAGYACFAQTRNSGGGTGVYVWSVGLANAGGCVNSSNEPLMVNNWANITFGTCTSSASSHNSNMNTSSCTYTGAPVAGQSSQTFTCTWTGGTFRDLSGTTGSGDNNGPNFSDPYSMPSNTWNGQPATLLAQNASCKSNTQTQAQMITAAQAGGASGKKAAKELLARYQCYANAYWQNTSSGKGSTSCTANYQFDWSTDNYANFVLGDARDRKPQNAYMTDRVFYTPDGQWAFLKNKETRYQSIPTASGSTLCPLVTTTELKFGKQTESKLLVNFMQRTVMADRSTACQAAVKAALDGGGNLSPDPTGLNSLYQQLQTQRMLFYVTK